jgi:hypothetical protein
VNKAIETLVKSLKDDPDYYNAWKANIAMAFVDNARWYREKNNKVHLSGKDIHAIANQSADYFLKLFMEDR